VPAWTRPEAANKESQVQRYSASTQDSITRAYLLSRVTASGQRFFACGETALPSLPALPAKTGSQFVLKR
jgi:hypothetical protein